MTSNAHRPLSFYSCFPSALPQTEIHPNLRSPNLESLTTRSLSSAFLLSAQQMTFPLGPTPAFHTARLAYRAVDPTADLPFLKALDADPTTYAQANWGILMSVPPSSPSSTTNDPNLQSTAATEKMVEYSSNCLVRFVSALLRRGGERLRWVQRDCLPPCSGG